MKCIREGVMNKHAFRKIGKTIIEVCEKKTEGGTVLLQGVFDAVPV